MSNPCPVCRTAVDAAWPQNPNAPFCSKRCKTVDLGRWLDGRYALPVRDEAPDEATVAELSRNPRGQA